MEDWLAFAHRLKEGTHRKFSHDCGPGECRIVSHKREGYGWSCFRCGGKGWSPRPAESLREKIARLRLVQAVERAASVSVSLPTPKVTETSLWPLAARCWLYVTGISNVEIAQRGIYWNPRLERVVIPIYDAAGTCVYWQARSLDKSNLRKVLNPAVDKSGIVYRAGSGSTITLTEDILSTLKLAKCGVESWGLLGTKLSTPIATELIRRKLPVITMLDPDAAGQRAASKIIKQLRSYGVEVRNVVLERDPKYISKEQLCNSLKLSA